MATSRYNEFVNVGIKILSTALLALSVSAAFAEAPTADSLMATANAKAKKEHKNVLVIFHASWCGWCHKLDDMLASKEVGPTMAKAYVVVHMVIDESKEHKAEENAGGDKLRVTLKGEKAGLPFFAVLTPAGKNLGTSIHPKTGNVGYPAAPNEIAHFMDLMKLSSPMLSDKERASIESYLKETAIRQKLVPAPAPGSPARSK